MLLTNKTHPSTNETDSRKPQPSTNRTVFERKKPSRRPWMRSFWGNKTWCPFLQTVNRNKSLSVSLPHSLCCHGLYNLNDKFIYITQRVFGANAGSTVANADGCTLEFNKIATISPNDTTNPTKSTKVRSTTPTHAAAAISTPIDHHRANWWIGLRTMWSRAGTSLRMRKRNFIPLTCMRRKRERLDTPKAKFLFFSSSQLPVAGLFSIINPNTVCTRSPIPAGIIMKSHSKGKLTRKVANAWTHTNPLDIRCNSFSSLPIGRYHEPWRKLNRTDKLCTDCSR